MIQNLAKYAGKYNLSLNAAVANSLKRLLLLSFQLGQQNPNSPPEDFIPSLNRKSFTKSLIAEGLRQFDSIMSEYNKFKIVAIAVDAGKLGSSNYLDIIICNAFADLHPVLFKAFQNFHGTQIDYVTKINTTITEIEDYGLSVTGIVCDGLRVQTNAINSIIEKRPCLFHIPCGAHSLHNAVKDMTKDHSTFQMHVDYLETFAILTNKKDILSKLKIAMPKRCVTRWTNIFDMASFIMNHLETYLNFLMNEEIYNLNSLKNSYALDLMQKVINESAPTLALLLYYPKKLSNILEKDNISFGHVYGFEKSTIIQLQQLAVRFPDIEDFCYILAEKIEKRLNRSEHGKLEKLAFLLTPEGRKIFNAEEAEEDPSQIILKFSEFFPLNSPDDDQVLTKYADQLHNPPDCPLLKSKISELVTKEKNSIAARNEKERKERIFRNLHIERLKNNISEEDYLDAIKEQGLEEFLFDNKIEEESSSSDEEFVYDPNQDSDDDLSDEIILENGKDPIEELLESEVEEEMASVTWESFTAILPRSYIFDDLGMLLRNIAVCNGLNEDNVTLSFSQWFAPLSSNTECHISNDNLFDLWNFLVKNPTFKDLSVIAQRLLIIPASEASCERMFWKQRKILCDERNRCSPKLAFSKLVLMSGDD